MFFFLKRIMARAKNDAGERIESLRFSVPALRAGVLTYGAGQLQTNNIALDGKPVRLYYPPEAVSNEKFLKSLETAPVVVGGHDSTTNEQNKKIDGWAHNVFFDAIKNAAMLEGVVKGAKEVAYVKGNLGSQGFGASAFIDIYDLKVESGMTPNGEAYDAIANDLRATHVALAPHVRDPENKIRVTNAVCINTEGATMTVENGTGAENMSDITDTLKPTNVINVDPVAFSAAVKNAVKETRPKATAKNMKYRVYFSGGRTKDVDANNRGDVISNFKGGNIEYISLILGDGRETGKEKVTKEDVDYFTKGGKNPFTSKVKY